jgi:hypothetical protein
MEVGEYAEKQDGFESEFSCVRTLNELGAVNEICITCEES